MPPSATSTAGAGAVAPNSSNLGYTTGSFNPEKMQKLFRFNSRELGEETQRKIKIGIKDLRAADPLDTNQYGTFTVVVRDIRDTDAAPVILEQYNQKIIILKYLENIFIYIHLV